MEDKIYEMARKRVAEKKGFYQHFSVYLAVGAFFFIMNALGILRYYEFLLMPWGAGLAIHYFSVFGLPGGALSRDWEEQELRKEINRVRSKVKLLEGPKRADGLDLRPLKGEGMKGSSSWSEDELV